MRRVLLPAAGLLTAVGLLLPAINGTASASASAAISWAACSDPTLAPAECGSLEVPLDRADPSGAKVSLALTRVRHKAPDDQYLGVVLATPGLLAGGGLRSALIGTALAGPVADRYDWVGFAQRGLAPSAPALNCGVDHLGHNRPNYVPSTPALERTWLARSKTFADACAAAQPSLIEHMKTTDTTADMESIRTALGVAQVTVFAQSYGSYTGQVYATQHPSRVKRMILDSAVDPRRIWTGAAGFDADVPLQRSLGLWLDWLAANDAAYHLGSTRAAVEKVWNEQVRRVSATPINGLIGFDEWIDAFLIGPYFTDIWPTLGTALAAFAHNNDGSIITAVFDQLYQNPGAGNTYAALLAQVCTDAPWPATWQQWRSMTWARHAQAPLTSWGNTWFNAPCFFWHAKPGTPARVDGSKVSSTLLIHQTLDAAAPYEGSLEVRSRFPHSALVAQPGGIPHASQPNNNPCVRTIISTYLTTGHLPTRKPGRTADAECTPNPLPVP
jgi:pimeloyl-ACP methyl ester carboxylesterase